MPAKSWSVWWESELPIAATMNWMWLKRTAMLINTPAMFYSSEPSSLGSQTLLEPYPICATEKPISPHWQQMRDEESQSHILWHVALRHCVTFFVASRITVLYLQFMVLRFWACPKLGIPPIHLASGCDEARDRKNVDPSRPQTYLSPSLIGNNETPTLQHYALAFQWLWLFSIMLHERGSLMLMRDFT